MTLEEKEKGRFKTKWKEKVDNGNHNQAIPGDHILAHFECDVCVFIKLKGRCPLERVSEEWLLLSSMKRVNLDAFWIRETSTVSNTLPNAKKMLKMSREVGLKGPFVSWGVIPEWYYCGYEVAIYTALDLRRGARHIDFRAQFNALRRVGSCFGDFCEASSINSCVKLALCTGEMGCKGIWKLHATSFWFGKFVVGMSTRIGQMRNPNLSLRGIDCRGRYGN